MVNEVVSLHFLLFSEVVIKKSQGLVYVERTGLFDVLLAVVWPYDRKYTQEKGEGNMATQLGNEAKGYWGEGKTRK